MHYPDLILGNEIYELRIARYRYLVVVTNHSWTIRYDARCYFNVRSKADISQLNLSHGTDN